MPRYRFSWASLPPSLLRELGLDLDILPPADEALRARYGARPEPDFVRDAWPTLLDAWLGRDRRSREWVIEALQARHIGVATAPLRSAADQMEYLRSCPNSSALREVVVAIFTAFGEAEPVRTPVPSESPAPPPSLSGWLEWAVGTILGPEKVRRSPDGDIPVRHGSTMCYVRSIDDPPSVRLFAPMVVDVPRTPALLEALNDINMDITVGRVFHTRANEIIFALELYGEQLTVEIIRASLAAATSIADHFDHELQCRFGGKTLFAEMDDDSVMV
jgi:hypothetical protein